MRLPTKLDGLNADLLPVLSRAFPDLTPSLQGLAILTAPDGQSLQRLILQGTGANIAPDDKTGLHLFYVLQNVRYEASPATAQRGRGSSTRAQVATIAAVLYTIDSGAVDFLADFLNGQPGVRLLGLDLNPASVARLLRLDKVPNSTNAGAARYLVAVTFAYRAELGLIC